MQAPDSDEFEAFVAGLGQPALVVTAAAGGDQDGCLVGFATQTSIDPPRFLVCLSRANRTYRIAQRTDLLAVHVLPADRPDLALLFGGTTGDDVDKLARVHWRPGPGGTPLLDATPRVLIGRIVDRFDLGDHEGVLLAPVGLAAGAPGPVLSVDQIDGIEPGHPA